MAFRYFHRGAMGEPGAVSLYLDNGELYHFNYVYGDVEIKTVQKMFVPLSKCKFGMFGLDSSAPKGWEINYAFCFSSNMNQTPILILLAKNEKMLILANRNKRSK